MKWKHHGCLLAQPAVNTLKVHIVLHEPLSGLLCMCIGIKKMFRKLLKILNQQDPNFFLFVLLELWFVYHFPRFFAVFRRWHTKLMRRESGTKLKNLTFDLNLLLAPTRAHQGFICICFLVVSLFMLACFFHGCLMAQRVLSN